MKKHILTKIIQLGAVIIVMFTARLATVLVFEIVGYLIAYLLLDLTIWINKEEK